MGKQREYVDEEIIKKKKQIQAVGSDLTSVIGSLSVLIQTKLPRVNSCRTAFSKFTKNVGYRFTYFWFVNIAFGMTFPLY